ncbi:MAG: FIST C-terminal domain-containing protein [Pseudomonadota bacterium]
MISCTGRGAGLYGRPGHDTQAFQKVLPDVPLAGFFGAGEIGPVGATTYVHGYTTALGVFQRRG